MSKTKIYITGLLTLKPMIYLLSFIIGVLSQSSLILMTMVTFVIVDLITGIWKSVKLKQKITSKALRSTIEKILSYFFVIILAKLFDEVVLNIDAIQVHTMVASLIFLVEFKSVTENMSEITGNKVFVQIYETVNKVFKSKKK